MTRLRSFNFTVSAGPSNMASPWVRLPSESPSAGVEQSPRPNRLIGGQKVPWNGRPSGRSLTSCVDLGSLGLLRDREGGGRNQPPPHLLTETEPCSGDIHVHRRSRHAGNSAPGNASRKNGCNRDEDIGTNTEVEPHLNPPTNINGLSERADAMAGPKGLLNSECPARQGTVAVALPSFTFMNTVLPGQPQLAQQRNSSPFEHVAREIAAWQRNYQPNATVASGTTVILRAVDRASDAVAS